MVELDLYLTEDDELQIITAALETGCKAIPDVYYSSAQYETLGTLEDYKRCRPRTRQFYFTSDAFFRCPLEMRKIEKGGKTVYYVEAGGGGPVICFMGGGVFNENGSQLIKQGFLAHASKYENTFKNTMEKSPTQLLEVYKSLVKAAKRSATRIKPGKRVFWLRPNARRALENGAKLVGYEGYSVHQLLE